MILELIGKRLLRGGVTLWMISLFIFFSVELLPGDLAENILGQAATPESVAALRTKLGLDQPGYVRYWQWASGVFSGDLGVAVTSGRPVSELILVRIGNTFFLAIVAAAIAVPLALCLGMLTALLRNTVFDRVANALTLSSISVPEFFIAYILIFVLGISAGWFPTVSDVTDDMSLWDRVYEIILPALTLTMVVTAHMMRMAREIGRAHV